MPYSLNTIANLKADQLSKLIGNTPFISVSYSYDGGEPQAILVKCEQYNLTGSIRDRLALYILQKAQQEGKLKKADLIVVASTGDSGVSYAAIGKIMGYRVKIIMSEVADLESRERIKSFGADLQLVNDQAGGSGDCIQIAEAMAHLDQVFLPKQFEDRYSIEAYERTIGREIGHSLILEKLKPAAFVGEAGATLLGIGKYLRTIYPAVELHPISNDTDHINMAQKIKNELAMSVGITSGANLLAAIGLQQQMGMGNVVVTVFPDACKKYRDTDPSGTDVISSKIRLLGYELLNK